VKDKMEGGDEAEEEDGVWMEMVPARMASIVISMAAIVYSTPTSSSPLLPVKIENDDTIFLNGCLKPVINLN